jgi:hypothetical protein
MTVLRETLTQYRTVTSHLLEGKRVVCTLVLRSLATSVADPDPKPDPSDPYVLGPPRSRSGSSSQRQGCGSGSDPDSIGSVDPDPDSESGSGSRRAKMTHKSRKKFVKVHVLKCWMAFFGAEGFFCNLDILGLGIGKLQF